MNSCIIYDVIDDKGQKIYFCGDGTNSIIRNSDSKTWYYDSIGIYEAIKNTYTMKGVVNYFVLSHHNYNLL